MNGRLKDKAILLTGGSTGLGFAMDDRILREGAHVVFTGRDTELGMQAEGSLGEAGEAWFVQADAADLSAVELSIDFTVSRLGGIDVLVNNAGVGVVARLVDTPVEDFDSVMAVNVRGCYLYARAAYHHLRRSRGCIINVSSDAGVVGEQSIGVYSVSKAAVIMLSNMLALDGGPEGVRSNCICPGDIVPGMRHMVRPGTDAREDDPSEWPIPPIGRLGTADDVANAAVFFASDESSFCNGAVLLIDGGMRAGIRPRV